MFHFLANFTLRPQHVHSVESIKTTRGHELGHDLMTEEFKMFCTYVPM